MDDWPTGRLLSMAARLVEHAWVDALESRDLTHAGMIALHFLDGGPSSQSELAKLAKVENQTMSRTIDRLERSGFVERSPDPADRRRQVVSRTRAGDEAWQSIHGLETEVFPLLEDSAGMRAGLLQIIRRSSENRWK